MRAPQRRLNSGMTAMILRTIYCTVLLTAGICTGTATARAERQHPQPPVQEPLPTGVAGDELQWFQGGRYRITPTDVIELTFPYVPEFNQVVTVQPDGYVTLKAVGEIRVQGRTVPEIRLLLIEAY